MCTNHLKQFGTAIHNFVSANDGKLPPSTIHESRASLYVMTMPFYEQQTLYQICVPENHETSMVDGPTTDNDKKRYWRWWTSVLTEDQRTGFGSIPGYKCPSRRSGVQLPTDFDTADEEAMLGPLGDYALPTVMNKTTGQSPMAGPVWYDNYKCNDSNAINNFFGPFRPARLPPTTSNLTGVILRDNIGYWADGTSNQLVMGEKHIPENRVGVCRHAGPSTSDWVDRGDCSMLTANDWSQCSVMRLMHVDYRLARGPSEYIEDANTSSPLHGYSFGSSHPGVCNFLIGDSSVRAVSNTVPMDTILCPLTNISDGASVTLP